VDIADGEEILLLFDKAHPDAKVDITYIDPQPAEGGGMHPFFSNNAEYGFEYKDAVEVLDEAKGLRGVRIKTGEDFVAYTNVRRNRSYSLDFWAYDLVTDKY
jgi:hypothetical protein